MRIVVDSNECVAHGECVIAAPSLFELEGENATVVTVLNEEPGDELRADAEEAARVCPAFAITIEE